MFHSLVLLAAHIVLVSRVVHVSAFSNLKFQPSAFLPSVVSEVREEINWRQMLHHGTRGSVSTANTMPEVDEEMTNSWQPFDLWLDLRGTAITPRTALSRLNSPFPVSYVIVSKEYASRAVQFWEEGDPDIMYADDVTGSLCNAKDSSVRYGTIIMVGGGSFTDPTPALDATANGGWVLVDSEDKSDNIKEYHEAISSLVDFLIGGTSLGSGSLSFGSKVSLPEDDAEKIEFECKHDKGGIAISCRTRADIVHAANALKSIDIGSLVTTESGILLRQSPPTESSASSNLSLQSALVLPFDTPLWETAILVFMTES